MQFLRTVLLLALSWPAVAMKDRTARSAVSMLLKGPKKVDTKTLVASLNEVATGLKTEDKKAVAIVLASKADCKKTDRDLKLALKKGKRTFDMSTEDYSKVHAQSTALSASVAELKGQIKKSSTELDTLQAKLKKMRKDKGLLKKAAVKSLQQVEGVITKTYLRDSSHKHKGPSALEKKVSSLEELSKSLNFLQTDEEASEEGTQESEQKTEKSPVLILKADKQAIVRASDATQKDFNSEEKKIIELVEVERKKLQGLEDNLQDLQPAISNKLKQAMEINRTLAAAKQGMDRDNSLMLVEAKKCKIVQDSLGKQKTKRAAAVNDVLMAAKVIQHMDTSLFLSTDLQGLKQAAVSFLQTDSSEEVSEGEQLASAAAESSGMGLEELVESYGTSMSAIEGPFDSVTKMISGLIASLKAQANAEVNAHQFCQDSAAKNRRDRIEKKNAIDTLTSTVRWSKMAIVRIDDDLKYLAGETKRLKAFQAAETTELAAETKRVGKEQAEHKLADEVITKAVVILTSLCKLKSSFVQEETSLLQRNRQSSKVGSRFSQCQEAAKLLKSASTNTKALDALAKSYAGEYKKMSDTINADAKKAQTARETEEKSTKSARAQRDSELATAVKDSKEALKELALIDKAKKELEHSCSHIETREEKMARRKSEIDALREALQVLNGEAIPA